MLGDVQVIFLLSLQEKNFCYFDSQKRQTGKSVLLILTLDGCNTTNEPADDATGYIIVDVSPAVFYLGFSLRGVLRIPA